MAINFRFLFGSFLLLWLVLQPMRAPALNGHTVKVATGPVVNAVAFRDSIGVSVHWEYKDTVYGRDTLAVTDAVKALGIRHLRGYDPKTSASLARFGVTAMLVAGPEVGTPEQIAHTVTAANAKSFVIDAVEGPNEADLFWPMHKYKYHGESFPAGTLAYQRDLYAAIRSRPELRAVHVIGPSLGRTYPPAPLNSNPYFGGGLADAVDFGNFHPYPFGGNSFSLPFSYDSVARYYWTGNPPSGNLDEYPYAFEAYSPPFQPRPMDATETGYPTWRNGVTEEVQAKYIPRLVAEYCRLGIRRTYLYELVDVRPDTKGGDMEAHFGLMRNDLTRKPAFIALQGLLALVKPIKDAGHDNEVAVKPKVTLLAHMPAGLDRPRYVHSLIVQRSMNESILLIWHEVASADTVVSPPRSIAVPPGQIDVTPQEAWRPVAWFDYDLAWHLDRHEVAPNTASVSVPLRDQVVAVLMHRAS